VTNAEDRAVEAHSSNDYLFIVFLLVALVKIENGTRGECRRTQICSQIVRFPSIEMTVCSKQSCVAGGSFSLHLGL
jgi:hypothetical protein